MQLKWSHSFQFAGYYAAEALGYYRDAGLDVTVVEGTPGIDVVESVFAGNADFGIGNSGLLLERYRGRPVVALATIFQHSPLVLIARADDPLQSIHDLAGKSVMIEPHSEELLAYFRQEGLDRSRLRLVEHGFSERALIDGTVDAMSAYASHEPYFLDQVAEPYQLYSPRSVGIDFYGDTLFTSGRLLDSQPAMVQAFVDASLHGWRYALAHPQEIITIIQQRYDMTLDPDFLRFQVERMKGLIQADLVEIGYMNPGRWRHIADVYSDLGMMDRDFPLNGFLYRGRDDPDLRWLYLSLFGAVGLAGVLFTLTMLFARVSQRARSNLVAARRAEAARAESEGRLKTLMEMASAGICMLQGRRLVFVNVAMTQLTGYQRDELLAMSALEFVDPDYRESIARRAESRQQGCSEPSQYEIKVQTKDGEARWIDVTAALTTYQGCKVSIATLYDVTDRKRAEESLRESEQQFRFITENMHDVIWVMDAFSGRLNYVSPSIRLLLGFEPKHYTQTSFEQWLAPESRTRIQALHPQRLRAFLNGEANADTVYRDEIEHMRIDGSTVWCEVVASFRENPLSERAELYGVTRDISKRRAFEEDLRRANAKLKTMATTDALTGLPNRRLLYEVAEHALVSARRKRTWVGIMSLDLDRFKKINDSHGHVVGDQVLIETARRLSCALREADMVSRFGGDEFVILLPDISHEEDLSLVGRKIDRLFAEPFAIDDLQLEVSVSIGGAIYPRDGNDTDQLIKSSDRALYISKKRKGKGSTGL